MTYQNPWSLEKDQQLRALILDKHEYDWFKLASYFSLSVEEVKGRWQDKIYPTIRSDKKIAGAFIWTPSEDKIIQYAGIITNSKLENILEFLPGRTHFSLEARWKRIHMKNILEKKKPTTQDIQAELIRKNHQKRLKQYQEILKKRDLEQGGEESDIQKIVETRDNLNKEYVHEEYEQI